MSITTEIVSWISTDNEVYSANLLVTIIDSDLRLVFTEYNVLLLSTLKTSDRHDIYPIHCQDI